MKKRFLSLFMALTLCLGLLPATALAAEDRVATDGAIAFDMDVADFGSLEYGYGEEDCPTLTITLTNTSSRSLWYIYEGTYFGRNSEFSPHVEGADWDDIQRYLYHRPINPSTYVYALELKPGSSASVDLTVETGRLGGGASKRRAGVYEGDLKFYFSNTGEPTGQSGDDPYYEIAPIFADGAYYTLPYRFEVTYDGYMGGEEAMELSRERIDFGLVEVDDTVTETISVTNATQAELQLQAKLPQYMSGRRNQLLTLEETRWTLAPGETAQIQIVKASGNLATGQYETELELTSTYRVTGGGNLESYRDEKVVPITFTAVKNGNLSVFVALESPKGPSGYFTSADGTTYWGNDEIPVPYGGDLSLNFIPFIPENGYILAVESGIASTGFHYMNCDDTLQLRNVTDGQSYRVSIASCAVPPAAWAREAVGRAYSLGIFHPSDMPSGWLDDRARTAGADGSMPSASYAAPISREDFCKLIIKLYQKVDKETYYALPDNYDGTLPTFTDTLSEAVRQLAYLGVITGTGDGSFNPDGELTREQAATILSRLAGVLKVKLPAAAPTFDDNGSISSWASDAVGQMQASGVMGGLGNGQFGPQGTYSWEQSIATLMRIYDMSAPISE